MKDNLGIWFMANKETFESILNKFKINNNRNSDFLLKSSKEFKKAVFKLCERIINDETIPDNFRDTTLHQIWKRKPGTRKEDLWANRHIHCKEWLPRTVESMVVQEMLLDIEAATSTFQIGGVAGHRSQEHVFCINWIMARFKEQKKMIILLPTTSLSFLTRCCWTLCRSYTASYPRLQDVLQAQQEHPHQGEDGLQLQ